MAETPEIPEAKDPFEKRAAVTIAILAVALAVVGNKGNDTKTEAIIKTNEAANGYAFFQAKGIKGSIASAQAEMLTLLAHSPAKEEQGGDKKEADQDKDKEKKPESAIDKKVEALKKDAERYKEEQVDIKKDADKDKEEAKHELAINKRCDHGELALQIGIVIASVSILARSRAFWIASIILGLIGVGIGVSAFLI